MSVQSWTMILNPQARLFHGITQCLLSLWLLFGCLEMLEGLHLVPETGVEDQRGGDADEEALGELQSSGLKSEGLFAGDNHSSVILASVDPTLSVSFATFDPSTRQNLPPPS